MAEDGTKHFKQELLFPYENDARTCKIYDCNFCKQLYLLVQVFVVCAAGAT